MGMSLYEMLSEEHESTLKIGRAAVKLRSLDREMISPALWRDIGSLQGVSEDNVQLQDLSTLMMGFARIVTELVVGWSFVDLDGNEGPLLGKDGRPVNLVLDEVATLPLRFLQLVIAHVTTGDNASGEVQPGKTMSDSLSGTSSRQVRPAPAQSGTRSLSPRNVSTAPRGSSSRVSRIKTSGPQRRSSR